MRDVLSQELPVNERPDPAADDGTQAAAIRDALEGKFVCPFCGVTSEGLQTVCPKCTMENTPVARKATKSRIGPWYVLQARNPAAPGMRWETLREFVRKGRVKPQSIVRGPTTHQFWRFAAHVKGLSREFGVCYSCGGAIDSLANLCPQCNRLQEPPIHPDTLLETAESESRLPVFKEIPQPAPAMLPPQAPPAPVPVAFEPTQATDQVEAQPQDREQREAVAREREEVLRQRDDVFREREEVSRERDELLRARDALAREREEVLAAREEAARERDEVFRTREDVTREREGIVRDREAVERDKEAAAREGELARKEQESIAREREVAARERETIEREREAVLREREAVRAQREMIARERDAAAARASVAPPVVAAEPSSPSRPAPVQHAAADRPEAAVRHSQPAPEPEADVAGLLHELQGKITETEPEPSVWEMHESPASRSPRHDAPWSAAAGKSALASEKGTAGGTEAAGLKPRPRDGFLSAKDLAAAFKLNFEPAAHFDASHDPAIALAAADAAAFLADPQPQAPAAARKPGRWKWFGFVLFFFLFAVGLIAFDSTLSTYARHVWQAIHPGNVATGHLNDVPRAPPADPDVPSDLLPDSTADGGAPALPATNPTTRPSTPTSGPSGIEVPGVSQGGTVNVDVAKPLVPAPPTQPAATPTEGSSTGTDASPDSSAAPAPPPKDALARERQLLNAAQEAEVHQDFKEAARLFAEIKTLPRSVWPSDLELRLKLAVEQQRQ